MSDRGSFFEHLNKDVRMIIYDYLCQCLPPLSLKDWRDDCRGLILSCKQANYELSAVAFRQLRKFIREIPKRCKSSAFHSVSLLQPQAFGVGFESLQKITVNAEVAMSHPWTSPKWSWDSCPLTVLLERPFQKVTVIVEDASVGELPHCNYIKGDPIIFLLPLLNIRLVDMVTSRWEKNQDRRDLEAMCEIYNENLGKTEGLENAAIKLSEDSELCTAEMATLVDPLIPFEVPKGLARELFNDEDDYNFALAQWERISNYTVRRGIIRRYRMDKSPSYGMQPLIRTKTIELAWNFSKNSNDSPINLYGKSSMLVDSRAFNTFGWIELPDDERRSRWNSYWLRTTDGNIGKVGISSSARWQFTGRSVSHYTGLSFVKVWSKRIERSGTGRDFVPNFVPDFALDSD